jgi:hypothetical protein
MKRNYSAKADQTAIATDINDYDNNKNIKAEAKKTTEGKYLNPAKP